MKMMVSRGIAKDGLAVNKVYSCGVCGLRVKTYSVLCVEYGNCIHI